MKLGDGVEATIHCTTMLAGLSEGAVLSAAALAEYHGVSSSYLVKHLKTLVASGILVSTPGPAGGYRLGRDPKDITLLDVVLAVEGPEPAFRCAEIRQRGPNPLGKDAYPKPCGISVAMLKAEQAYRAALRATTLADIITDFMDEADPRLITRGCAFLELNERGKAKIPQ